MTIIKELPPGWAYKAQGFTIQVGEKTLRPDCQANMGPGRDGTNRRCDKTGRYARTLWNGATIFSCGRHRKKIEQFAQPYIAQRLGGRGPIVEVIKPHMEGPDYREVPGAAEPAEHPRHLELELEPGMIECWCGAKREPGPEDGRAVWKGGKPTDTPPWEG